jgi:hypothetical protein
MSTDRSSDPAPPTSATRARAVALISLVFVAACVRPPARGAPIAGPPHVDVPLVRERGYALVPVTVGDVGPLWFVLDVAAGGSVISPATRDALGLSASDGTMGRVVGASGSEDYQSVPVPSMRVGPYTQGRMNVTVIDLQRFERPESGRTFAGILGTDVLRNFDFVLDLPRGSLRLYPHETRRASAPSAGSTRWPACRTWRAPPAG